MNNIYVLGKKYEGLKVSNSTGNHYVYGAKAPKFSKYAISAKKILKVKVDVEKLPPAYDWSEVKEVEKDIPSFDIVCNEQEYCSKEFLIEYIARNKINISYAKSIVRKVASNPLHRNSNSCLQLVKDGYSHMLFEDIAEDMLIVLMELISDGKCFLEKENGMNFIRFDTHIINEGTEKEKEQSYYVELYKSLGRTLKAYTNTNQHFIKKKVDGVVKTIPISVVNYDAIATQEEDNTITLEYMITTSNPNYLKSATYAGGIKDVIENDSFLALMAYFKAQVTANRFKTLSNVIKSMLLGETIEECAKRYDYTLSKVKKARQEIKELYQKAVLEGFEISKSNDDYNDGLKIGNNCYYEFLGVNLSIPNNSRKYFTLYKHTMKDLKKHFYVTGIAYNTSYNPVYKCSDYIPSIGAISLISMDDSNKNKDFNASNSSFDVKEGKKVFNVNKDKGIIEVWNYISENGYIYSKELLRTYPIAKG